MILLVRQCFKYYGEIRYADSLGRLTPDSNVLQPLQDIISGLKNSDNQRMIQEVG